MRVTRDTYQIAKAEWGRIDTARKAKRLGVTVAALRAQALEDERMTQIRYAEEQIAQIDALAADNPVFAAGTAKTRATWTERRQALLDGFFA